MRKENRVVIDHLKNIKNIINQTIKLVEKADISNIKNIIDENFNANTGLLKSAEKLDELLIKLNKDIK